MFRILSRITDYFYITDSVENNNIQSIEKPSEEPSNLSDYEVICMILGKEFCPDLSKSIEEIKKALFLKIFHEKITSQNVATILKIVDSLPDERSKALFYKDICEVYLQKKNFDQALHITTFIKDKYIASNLLETLSLDLFREGRLAEALQVVNSIHSDAKKAIILRNMCIEVASEKPSACFHIIDCFPQSEQRFKDGTLTELMHMFIDRAESTKIAEKKSACNQLALRFGKMLEYDSRLRIRI